MRVEEEGSISLTCLPLPMFPQWDLNILVKASIVQEGISFGAVPGLEMRRCCCHEKSSCLLKRNPVEAIPIALIRLK